MKELLKYFDGGYSPVHCYVYVVYAIVEGAFGVISTPGRKTTCRDDRTLSWKARYWMQRRSYGRKEERRRLRCGRWRRRRGRIRLRCTGASGTGTISCAR